MNSLIVHQIESLTGKVVSDEHRDLLTKGAEEEDLVYSGLEETMITALKDIILTMEADPAIDSMRTAAFVLGIRKVGVSYNELGIFP